MAKKTIKVLDFLTEHGILKEQADKDDIKRGIRWFNRNIPCESTVCITRGVYIVDEDEVNRKFKDHVNKARQISTERSSKAKTQNQYLQLYKRRSDLNQTYEEFCMQEGIPFKATSKKAKAALKSTSDLSTSGKN